MQKIAIPEEALKTDYVKYCNDTEILDLRILFHSYHPICQAL